MSSVAMIVMYYLLGHAHLKFVSFAPISTRVLIPNTELYIYIYIYIIGKYNR